MISLPNSKPGAGFESLNKAIETSYKALEPFRNLNRKLTEAYAGPAYGNKRGREKLLNKMNQAVDAYIMLLAANRPQVKIETDYRELTAFAKHFEIAVNNLLIEIGVEHTVRQWVMDAFFCIGIVKVHLADSVMVQFEQDLWADPGIPFASNVSLDDFVYDMSAKRFTQVKFAGDVFRIPYEDLEAGVEQGIYKEHALESSPTSKYGGDDQRLEAISRGSMTDSDEFEPMIDLADIWIPRDGKIYTFIVDRTDQLNVKGDPIGEMDWEDDKGPYHILGYNDVPENIMPVSPASHLDGLDRLINNLMRKAKNQAERQKQNPIYSYGGSEDAKRLREYGDGEWVMVNNPSETKVLEQGGVNPGTVAFMGNALELFDSQAGNLTALLGLGAQSDTLGQEQLIHDAGSRKIGQMQYRVVEATSRLIESLGLMLWKDEFKTIVGKHEFPGADISVNSTWKPGRREGNFMQYNFKIAAHSMAYRPPSEKAQTVTQLITQIFLPLSQILMQQGGAINFQKLREFYAEYLEIPQIRDIIEFQSEMPRETGPQSEIRGTKPPVTTRNYVRSSRPAGIGEKNSLSKDTQAWLSSGYGQSMQNGNGTVEL